MQHPQLSQHSIGSKVQWRWLGRDILGVVKEVYTETIIKTIKGKAIKRKGSVENPAYLVESVAGNLALKLHSELKPASTAAAKGSRPTPRMFSDD